jgi:fatty-acyl-CoA synthase
LASFGDCVELVAGLSGADPERGIVLVDPRLRETSHPYAEVFRRVRALARRFRSQGVRQGQKVLVALPTEIDSVCSFLALIYVGAVPYSISSPLLGQDREAHRRQVLNLVGLHRVDRLLCCRDLGGIAGTSPEAPEEMALALPSPAPEELRDDRSVEPASVAPDDVAFVQFSSGSTSHPKGVQITHRNLLYNLGLVVENDRRTERSVTVSWLPLYHDMGLVGGLLSNLVLRNPLVLMDPMCFIARPVNWLAAISRWGGTVSPVPNFALDLCNDRVTEEQMREGAVRLGSLQYVYVGAEPVHARTVRRFEERFRRHGLAPGRLYPVYGMAETTLIVTAPAPDESLVTKEIEGVDVPSVGRPLGDFELQVRDEKGKALPAGRPGEICLRGSSLTPGYVPAQGPQAGSIRGGWLATGDLGLFDEDGRLYVTGRKKDLIICQGRNFHGHDIAACIEELPYVRRGRVFVFGVSVGQREEVVVMMAPPRKRAGESREGSPGPGGPSAWPRPLRVLVRALANLLRRPGGEDLSPDLETFRTRIRKLVLREFGLRIHEVLIVPRLPKTTSGKFERHRCLEIYHRHRGGPAGPGG